MSLEYDISEEIVGLLAAEETYYREMCEYTHDLRITKKVLLEVDLPVKPSRLIARSIGRGGDTKKSREEQVDEFHCFLLSKKHDWQARYRRHFDRDLPLHEQVVKLGVSVKYHRNLLDYFDLGRKLEQLKSECKKQRDMEKYVNVLEKISFKMRHAYKIIKLYKIMDSAPFLKKLGVTGSFLIKKLEILQLVVKKYNWS